MDYKHFKQHVRIVWERAEEPDEFIVVFEGKDHDGSCKINYEVAYWDCDTEEITFICPTAGYEDYHLCGVYDLQILVELANEVVSDITFAKRSAILGYQDDIRSTHAWKGFMV